jgi:hypothetical protein
MVWVNPASPVVGQAAWDLSLSGTQGYFDEVTGAGSLGFRLMAAEIFLGGAVFDAGGITLNASDGTSRTVICQRDTLGMLNMAVDLGFLGRQGCQILAMRSELLGEYTAKSVVGSWGARLDASDNVSMGASLRNIGKRIRYAEDSIPSPTLARAGFMYRVPFGKAGENAVRAPIQLRLVGDAEYSPDLQETSMLAGAEFLWMASYYLRSGVRIGPDGRMDAVTAGFGVDMRVAREGEAGAGGRYIIDYAIRYKMGSLESPSSFNLTLIF